MPDGQSHPDSPTGTEALLGVLLSEYAERASHDDNGLPLPRGNPVTPHPNAGLTADWAVSRPSLNAPPHFGIMHGAVITCDATQIHDPTTSVKKEKAAGRVYDELL